MSVEEIIIQLREIQRTNGRIFDQQFFASNEAIDHAIQLLSRPKGKWVHRHYIAGSGRTVDTVYCTECGEEYSYDAETGVSAEDYNSCPNCGAYMRGEE